MKLGTLLLRDAVISLSQLEAALRTQVLVGGRLGTNLVELGHLDVDTLGVYLGRSLVLPVATKEMFEAVPGDLISSFDRDLAELYGAFPLGAVADENGDASQTLAVALVDPNDRRSLEQLAGQLGRPLAPYAAPELRLYYYLERHYGIERKARFVRPGTNARTPDPDQERRRAQPARGIEMPQAMRFEPRGAKARSGKTDKHTPATPARSRTRVDKKAADAQIGAADTRNRIGDTLVDFAVGRFHGAAVLILRDANAIGWRMHSATNPGTQTEFEKLSLALGGASALQAAHDSRQPFRGEAPSAGRPVERRLWRAMGLGESEPGEMIVAPIMVKARVVNLVYAHSAPGERLVDEHVDALLDLARRAADAYIRLIKMARQPSNAD